MATRKKIKVTVGGQTVEIPQYILKAEDVGDYISKDSFNTYKSNVSTALTNKLNNSDISIQVVEDTDNETVFPYASTVQLNEIKAKVDKNTRDISAMEVGMMPTTEVQLIASDYSFNTSGQYSGLYSNEIQFDDVFDIHGDIGLVPYKVLPSDEELEQFDAIKFVIADDDQCTVTFLCEDQPTDDITVYIKGVVNN